MHDLSREGQGIAKAWASLADARKLLSSPLVDAPTILALGRAALMHLSVGHLLSAEPARQFLSARLEDTLLFSETLDSGTNASAVDLGTFLLSVEFVLRAAQYQDESA